MGRLRCTFYFATEKKVLSITRSASQKLLAAQALKKAIKEMAIYFKINFQD